jgi:hypothetical protein
MNSLPTVTWPQLVYHATPFGNNCCCCLRSCRIASTFCKLPSHICVTDSEKPLAPCRPPQVRDAFQILIGRLQTLRARYQYFIALYCFIHKIVISCAVGFACSMLWFVLLDLRVPFCSLCFWICVFHVVDCAVGFA